MAASTSNLKPLRQTYLRSVGHALIALTTTGDAAPLDKTLAKMERWVNQAEDAVASAASPTDVTLDPRVSWQLWAHGDMGPGRSDTEPLPAILGMPVVPMAMKVRALALAQRLIALCPHELNRPGPRSFIQPETWLLAADVPGIDAFVAEHEAHLRTNPKVAVHDQLESSWRNLVVGGHTIIERCTLNVSYLQDQATFNLARHEHTVFTAALKNGWADVAWLERWPDTYRPGHHHPATERLRQVALNPNEAGSVLDVLAVDASEGLLDLWRAHRPDDWSVWVNPATGTTVWRSLLAGDEPTLIARWLKDDPAALDRPVPNGRWLRDEDGLGNVRRSFAGTTWNERDAEEAMEHAGDPAQNPRFQAWWDNPAPTLRETVWALTTYLFPTATPFLNRTAWYGLANTIEAHDLRTTLDADGAVMEPSKARSRL